MQNTILRLFHKARMLQYLHSVLLRWTGRSRVGGKEICCCLLALSLKIAYAVICRRRQWMSYNACGTCSTIIFPYSANHVIDSFIDFSVNKYNAQLKPLFCRNPCHIWLSLMVFFTICSMKNGSMFADTGYSDMSVCQLLLSIEPFDAELTRTAVCCYPIWQFHIVPLF